MPNRFQQEGGQPQKQPHYEPIFIDETFRGLVTNRVPFHDPADMVTRKFYGGYPDALWTGSNTEISNALTVIRRPGTTPLSSNTYNDPNRSFSFHLTDGTIQVLVDDQVGVYWDHLNGTKTTVLTKAAGAGQAYFMGVGDVCYIGDGVDLVKYTPNNTNGTLWKWGIIAPPTPISIVSLPSGASAVAWAASTVFSTMGFIVDGNTNVQQLYSVNALANNSTQIGESGNGAPAFNLTTGGTTTDGGVTWTTQGQITLWTANTLYAPGAPIYDPTTTCIFVMSHSTGRTSGSTKPAFNSTLGLSGARIDDTNSAGTGGGNARWECLGTVNGSPTAVLTWQKDTAYLQYQQPSGGTDPSNINSAIAYPLVPYLAANGTLCNGTATYLLGATTPGTTANTSYTPWTGIVSQTIGSLTQDNQLEWLCLGSATWAATTTYTAWQFGSTTFSAIKDSNGNMQVAITGGQSAASAPTWQTNYGGLTQDNTVTWVCVGTAMSWTANTNWYLPSAGFTPPTTSQPYGGASVVGSNFTQFVVNSGLSGSSAPSWATSVGTTTTDNAITWFCVAAYTAQSLSWTKGHNYYYAFKCRTSDDDYVTTSLLTFENLNPLSALTSLGNVPGLTQALGVYTGGGTGAISSTSPVATITGANTGAVNVLTGLGSTDPQVDTIVIYRDADGGGIENCFELIEIPAPKPIAGKAQTWQFRDFLPDAASTINNIEYPGLDNQLDAPINGVNDPPQAGFLPFAYHFGRVFGGISEYSYFSGGPDILPGTGNPNECFNKADEFQFLSPVITQVHTPAGLVTFLQNEIQCIYGGPQTESFYQTTLFPGKGTMSFNSVSIFGGEIYFFSSDGQGMVITPSLQLNRIGWDIGDKLVQFNPADVYITMHDVGVDTGLYIGNGSTGWYRCNPHQPPQGTPVWSPFATITGGCKMLQSVEVTPGVFKLLIGGTTSSSEILYRDLTVWTDNGTPYEANFQVGAITCAEPGQLAALKFVEFDFTGLGSKPTVSYLLDAPSGTFTPFGPNVYTTLGSYTFTGANVNPLPTPPWIADPADSIPAMQLLSNEGVATNVSESIGIYSGATFPLNQFAEVQLDSLTGGGTPDFSGGEAAILLVMRRTDASHGFAMEIDGNASGTLGAGCGVCIFSENGGSQTFYLGTAPLDALVDIFPGDSIRMELNGGFISAYVIHNGVSTEILAPTACDTSLTGTEIALDVFCNTLVTDAQVSNFSAGSITPAYVYDPPSVYAGTAITPTNYYPLRYYFGNNTTVARCRRIMLEVDYGLDTVQNETISLCLFGRIYQET